MSLWNSFPLFDSERGSQISSCREEGSLNETQDSQDLEDFQEFQDLAGSEASSGGGKGSTRSGNNWDEDDYVEKPKGDISCWVNTGNNQYTPSAATEEKLPPGIYKASITPRGQLIWEKIKIQNDELIRLPDTASDRVIAAIRTFWGSKKKFSKKKQLYKRGVLLWGPPGSGKTATVTLLMAELVSKGGVVLVVDQPKIATEALRMLRMVEPKRPLICVLEDLDELVQQYGEAGILALLDGESQVDNIVHIATTNYPEHLDARIINRPSRFDEVIKIGMPTAEARKAYLRSKISDEELNEVEIDNWVNETDGFSVAHLRELVVAVFCLGRDYEATLKRLKGMSRRVKSTDERTTGFGVN